MFSSAPGKQGACADLLTNVTSVRLFVLLALCSFWVYKYVLKAVKYRV